MKICTLLFRTLPFVILFSFTFSLSAFGQGSPPLMTDDSGVPGSGKWENNLGFGYEGNSSEHSLEGPIIDLNYGVGEHTQLKFEIGWIAAQGQSIAGYLDAAAFGVKYNFAGNDEESYQFSVYPQILFGFNNENGKKVDYGFELPVALTKEFPEITVNVQLGFEMFGDETHGLYGLSLGKELTENFELMAELHGVFAKAHTLTENGGEHEFFFNEETFINIGAAFKVNDIISIVGAFGKNINTSSQSENGPIYFAFGGIQFFL